MLFCEVLNLLNGKRSFPNYGKTFPPIFIIGPPRSGTTLLYQLMSRSFDLGYINNFIGWFFRCPVSAAYLFKKYLNRSVHFDLKSKFGTTSGLNGTNEFGDFYYRWFPKKLYYKSEDPLTDSQVKDIRNELNCIASVFNRSLILKNVVNSVRIKNFLKCFPDAVFIIVKRSQLDIAQSIFQARLKVNGNTSDWWSVKTKNFDSITQLSVWEQIAMQIYEVELEINKYAKDTQFSDRFLEIDYRELCDDPNGRMAIIKDFLIKSGIECNLLQNNIDGIKYSTGQKINDNEYNSLNIALKKVYDQKSETN